MDCFITRDDKPRAFYERTLSIIPGPGQPSAVPFDRQAGLDPVLLSAFVIANIRISHRRQFPGGIL
jgi:hypothetical protein